MAYTVTKRQSYGSRILNSFVGVLVGIALIIGMSILLFWNEGRYNPADLAETAVEITEPNPSLNGQLVYYKGTLTGGAMAFDGIIIDSNYIRLSKTAEVYAWIESSSTETHDNLGGSQTQTTTYTYALGWTSSPQDPETFEDPSAHSYPKSTDISSYSHTYVNSAVTTEDFTVDMDTLTVDGSRTLPLVSGDTVIVSSLNADTVISGNYIYNKALGSTGPSTPCFNDIRVSYEYIPGTLNGLLLGKAEAGSIVAYTNEDASLYRFFEVSTLNDAVATLDTEFTSSQWMFRLIGAIGMCIGFALLTGPFSTLLMVVPFLGHASKFLLGIVTFLIGALFSLLVIAVSAIFHNIVALVIAIGVVLLLVIIGVSKRKKNKEAEGKSSKKSKKK